MSVYYDKNATRGGAELARSRASFAPDAPWQPDPRLAELDRLIAQEAAQEAKSEAKSERGKTGPRPPRRPGRPRVQRTPEPIERDWCRRRERYLLETRGFE